MKAHIKSRPCPTGRDPSVPRINGIRRGSSTDCADDVLKEQFLAEIGAQRYKHLSQSTEINRAGERCVSVFYEIRETRFVALGVWKNIKALALPSCSK